MIASKVPGQKVSSSSSVAQHLEPVQAADPASTEQIPAPAACTQLPGTLLPAPYSSTMPLQRFVLRLLLRVWPAAVPGKSINCCQHIYTNKTLGYLTPLTHPPTQLLPRLWVPALLSLCASKLH